jgi:hypothetical protein
MLKIMSVGARAEPLCEERVLEALFATISNRLETSAKTRFPILRGQLYWGRIQPAQAEEALRELLAVEEGLRNCPIRDVVWGTRDTAKGEESGAIFNTHAANALNYFVNVESRPLIAILQSGVQECGRLGRPLRITYGSDRRQEFLVGGVFFLLGAMWMWAGRAFVPGWVIAKSYAPRSGIPIWTFGMYLVLAGAAFVIGAISPAIRDCFADRPVLLFALVIAAIVGWLVVCANAGFLPD